MYQPNEYIVYGSSGVCQITDLCRSPFLPNDERMYYVMKPISDTGTSVIYTPVDNEAVPTRRLLTSMQIDELIARIPSLGLLEIEEEKRRKDVYKSALATVDPEMYIRLIKTVYQRRLLAKERKKRLPEMDNEYDSIARRCLYSELSLVLGIPYPEVEQYLVDRVEKDAAGV